MEKEGITDLYMGSDWVWYTLEELKQHEKWAMLSKLPLTEIEFTKQVLRILFP